MRVRPFENGGTCHSVARQSTGQGAHGISLLIRNVTRLSPCLTRDTIPCGVRRRYWPTRLLWIGITVCAVLSPTIAEARVGAKLGVASSYIFRGVPAGSPQVWGSLVYHASEGLYAGTWLSSSDHNSDFTDAHGDEPEADLFGGYTTAWSGLDWDAGYIAYLFPSSPSGEPHGNNSEVYLGSSSQYVSAYAYYNFGSDRSRFEKAPTGRSFSGDQFVYLALNTNAPLGYDGRLRLGAHVGYTVPTGRDVSFIDPYFDYGVKLSFNRFFVSVTASMASQYVLGGPNTGRSATGHAFSRPRVTVGYTWRWDDLSKLMGGSAHSGS